MTTEKTEKNWTYKYLNLTTKKLSESTIKELIKQLNPATKYTLNQETKTLIVYDDFFDNSPCI